MSITDRIYTGSRKSMREPEPQLTKQYKDFDEAQMGSDLYPRHNEVEAWQKKQDEMRKAKELEAEALKQPGLIESLMLCKSELERVLEIL